jgi:CheY-like chemotaxis protein
MTHPRYRILGVDDELPVASLLRDALIEFGYAVTVADTGADALNAVRQRAPDLVLLDLTLPDMRGLEVPERLNHRPYFSGNIDPMIAEAAIAHGAVDYIGKPVHPDVLRRVVAITLAERG